MHQHRGGGADGGAKLRAATDIETEAGKGEGMRELLDELAGVIYAHIGYPPSDGGLSDDYFRAAQAIIDHMKPMMDEVEGALEVAKNACEFLNHFDNCEDGDACISDIAIEGIKKTLTKLSAWRDGV